MAGVTGYFSLLMALMTAVDDARKQRAEMRCAVRQAGGGGLGAGAVFGKYGAAFLQTEQRGIRVFALRRVLAGGFAEGGAVGGSVQNVVSDLIGDAEVFAELVQGGGVRGVVGGGQRAEVQRGANERAGFAAVNGLQLRQGEGFAGRGHVAHLPANHPRPTGGVGKGLDLRQPGRGRKRTVRQQRESKGVQRIPGEDGGGLIKSAVRAGTTTTQVVIVHRRQVVVNERVGVDGLNRAGGGINTIRRHAEIVCRCIKQRRAQPLAATKGCITHGVGKTLARRRQDTAQGGFNARLITREGFGHEDECSKYKFGRDSITLISAVDDGVPDNMEARF